MTAAIVILCLGPVICPLVIAMVVPRDERVELVMFGLVIGLISALIGALLVVGVLGL